MKGGGSGVGLMCHKGESVRGGAEGFVGDGS